MTERLVKIEFLDGKAIVIGTKYEPYSPINIIVLPQKAEQIIVKIYELVTYDS
ncbi:hypothetical protein MUP77_19595 [Candidatus Bathyarchaeota archaeon]|nr:hypothetical protein [Candidatus Bathyarchaeota archaeon]